jgi:hypothetical protein
MNVFFTKFILLRLCLQITTSFILYKVVPILQNYVPLFHKLTPSSLKIVVEIFDSKLEKMCIIFIK